MKKILMFVVLLLSFAAFSTAVAENETSPEIPGKELSAPVPYPFVDAQVEALVREQLGDSVEVIDAESLGAILELECSHYFIRDLSDIAAMPNLRVLRLGCNANDQPPLGWQGEAVNLDLTPLRSLSGLEHISIAGQMDTVDAEGHYCTIELYGIDDLSPLADLNKLRFVSISRCGISDLSPLSGLKHLESLNLFYNEIGDLSPLSGLSALEYLDIDGNQISDLGPLSGLDRLTTISANSNMISDLAPLANMVQLKYLYLEHNAISDLSPLRRLKALSWLNLRKNDICDISPLRELEWLEWLGLDENRIADIDALTGLVHLDYLSLNRNVIPEDALSRLAFVPELRADGQGF